MREIKFRAWNGYMMISHKDFITIGKELCDDAGKGGEYKGCFLIPNHEDIKLMQYTGLKDINDKEIYEGDIVKCNENNEDLNKVKFGEFPLRDLDTDEIVEFVTGWYFTALENDNFSNVAPFCYPLALNDYWINKLKIKVVGNIYENKDLIK